MASDTLQNYEGHLILQLYGRPLAKFYMKMAKQMWMPLLGRIDTSMTTQNTKNHLWSKFGYVNPYKILHCLSLDGFPRC